MGCLFLPHPTGLGNYSIIPWFMLYLISNYCWFRSLCQLGKCPAQGRLGKEGSPSTPEAATGQGLDVSGDCAQGQTVVVALVLTGKDQKQLTVGGDDEAVLKTASSPHTCLFVFPSHSGDVNPSHSGDVKREKWARIVRGHSFLLEHFLCSPCCRPIPEGSCL